ncbi:MAG: hypothetical protein J6S23_02940 [Clostridia bacterium]|nr:hypothetical protein [Clostridia bacterium]
MIYNDVIFGSVSSTDFEIKKNELAARLNAGFDFENELLNKCINEFKKAATYRYAYIRVPISITNDICDFGFATVKSASLSRVLCDSKEAFIMAVSTGIEVDRLITKLYLKNDPSAFFIDAIGSAAVESLADHINDKICKNLSTTNRFSPGYADFPLEFQKDLLSRINANQTVGITLSEKLMMTPMKSITAIIGIK